MAITKNEYALAKGSPSKMQALYDREYKEYLLNGGIITRRASRARLRWSRGSLRGPKTVPSLVGGFR